MTDHTPGASAAECGCPDCRECVETFQPSPSEAGFGEWLERVTRPKVIGPDDWPTETEIRDDLTRKKTGRVD